FRSAVAAAADRGVEVEARDHRFGVGRGFDDHHRRVVVALRQRAVGEQTLGGFGEGKRDRRGTFAGGHGHRLTGGGDRLAVLADEGDADLALRRDQKLGVRLDRGDETAAVGAGDVFLVRRQRGTGEGEGKQNDEAEGGGFHFHDWVGGKGRSFNAETRRCGDRRVVRSDA